MRTRFVLVIVSLSIVFSAEILLGKKAEVPLKLSVRQLVDSEIHNLKRNLEAKQSPEQKWKALEKTEKEILSVRQRSPRQFEKDEVYMDVMMASLGEIPRKSEFKKEQCPGYKSRILSLFDPQGESQPAAPVAQALDVLNLLCH